MKSRKKTLFIVLCFVAALLLCACGQSVSRQNGDITASPAAATATPDWTPTASPVSSPTAAPVTTSPAPYLEDAVRENGISVGDHVTFGVYPQTAAGGDSTPIEWLVLDTDGEKALLLSRYGLDVLPFNTSYIGIDWETCTLRAWLNDTFLNAAFPTDERKKILLTDVNNSAAQGYDGWDTRDGNPTQDYLFLLSYAEANRYLGVTFNGVDNVKARLAPTAYAIAHGAYTNTLYQTEAGENSAFWWLRSPGSFRNRAAGVITNGSLGVITVDHLIDCVRPAMWVKIADN